VRSRRGLRRLLAPAKHAALLALAMPAALLATPAGAAAPGRFVEIPVAAGSGSLAPMLAVGPDGRLVLSWLEPVPGPGATKTPRGHLLRFSSWREGAWTRPLTVLRDDSLFVNWADVPSVVPARGDTLVAHWLRRTAHGTYDYGVRLARSTDGGRTWGGTLTPHRDGNTGEHGFVSLVDWPAGGTGAVWLDGRGMTGHGEDPGQSMTLRATVLEPGGGTGAETLLDARVCECCPTGAARAGDAVVVVYRDRSEREMRDMHVVRWEADEWSDPVRLSADGWRVAGCPVNGPAIAAAGDEVAVAWFTAPGDSARVMFARSGDGGRSFDAPVRVDEGSPTGRADVAILADGSAAVSWLEEGPGARGPARAGAGAPGGARSALVRVRRVSRDGSPCAPVTVARSSSARRAGIPRLVALGDRLVCAWTDPAEPTRIRSASMGAGDLPR
jgi:hypothetical protein